MKRQIILASHSRMAAGLRDTLSFIGGKVADDILVMTAYVDDHPIDQTVKHLMSTDSDTEVVILTDMKAGSVNQKFLPYLKRPHTLLITGMNLPLALAVLLEPASDYLTSDRITQLIDQARTEIFDMSTAAPVFDDMDE